MASKLEIELDDGEQRVLKLIKQAHQEKATIKQVRIEYWGEEGGIRLSNDQYDTIFTCVGLLPNLQDVIVHYSHEAPPLPVAALQKLIYCHGDLKDNNKDINNDNMELQQIATKKLEYLSLHRVKLEGNLVDFEALSESLRRNESLKKVHLRGCSSLTAATDNGNITTMEEENTTTIEGETPSDGQQEDYSNAGMSVLLQALAHLKSLTTLHLDNVQNLSQHAFWDLCQSKNIKVLELWNMTEDLNRYGNTIATALGGDNDNGSDGSDDDSVSTTKANNQATTTTTKANRFSLEELEISSILQPAAGNAIINMLQTNKTLETLGLDLDYAEYGGPLAQVLQPGCNATLKTLHLRLVGEEEAQEDTAHIVVGGVEEDGDVVDPPPPDEVDEGEPSQNADSTNSNNNKMTTATLSNALKLLLALESNTSLEHLHVNFYHISPETVQTTLMPSVEHLLQVNYALKDLTLRGKHNFAVLSEKAHFHLRLNRAGRYALLLGGEGNDVAPRSQWIDTIASHQQQEDDVSIVFYLLSTNPSLCCSAKSTDIITRYQ